MEVFTHNPGVLTLPAMKETEGDISVRLNRCIRLRQMHSSIKGNLSVVVQHHKAEGSSRINGMNKAIMKNLQRELQTWYREKSMLLEKMNRLELNRAVSIRVSWLTSL
jgi:hypothetical protein